MKTIKKLPNWNGRRRVLLSMRFGDTLLVSKDHQDKWFETAIGLFIDEGGFDYLELDSSSTRNGDFLIVRV